VVGWGGGQDSGLSIGVCASSTPNKEGDGKKKLNFCDPFYFKFESFMSGKLGEEKKTFSQIVGGLPDPLLR